MVSIESLFFFVILVIENKKKGIRNFEARFGTKETRRFERSSHERFRALLSRLEITRDLGGQETFLRVFLACFRGGKDIFRSFLRSSRAILSKA